MHPDGIAPAHPLNHFQFLPIQRDSMSAIRTEPRTAMMAVVEVSWEDQFGTRHTSSAKLEDTSPSGACLRVKVPVTIGSAMRVNSYRERFSGTARYCRTDRRDFIVGIQKDKNANRFLTDVVVPNLPPSVPSRNVPIASAHEEVLEDIQELCDRPHEENSPRAELARGSQNPTAASAVRARPSLAVMPSRDAVSVTNSNPAAESTFTRRLSQNESNDSPPPARFQSQSPRSGNPKGRENMPNKWSDLAPWRQKQTGKENDASAATQSAPASSHQANAGARRENSKSNSNPAALPEAAADANLTHQSPGDLLSMDDIYRAAGILAPRMGYSIRKVADMLASDHLRGVSDEMKRASVLMALDAAGISVDEVLRDAAMRQSAINCYESDQWEHFEEYWAAKAAENSHIQSELERITAQYQERIKRNLDEIAREKVIFATWQTMKQQEAQRIGEAAGICSKPSLEETFDEPQRAPRALIATAKPA
jgi:hypothetical protein